MTTPQPNPTDDLEAVARIIWTRFMSRLGGDWYPNAKPTDSGAMRDTFAASEEILAHLRPAGVGEAVAIPRLAMKTTIADAIWRYDNGEFTASRVAMVKAQDILTDATPAHPDAALMERVREALDEVNDGLRRIARIQDAPGDLETVKGALEWAHAGAIVAMCGPKFTEARRLLSDLKAEAGR